MKAARDQGDKGLDFNGQAGTGVNRGSNPYAGNMHQSGNPDALINKGQGPRGGGTAMPALGHDMFKGKPAQRQAVGDGATRAMPKTGGTMFSYGRGPTKGNQK
jgi:hypothetical protein